MYMVPSHNSHKLATKIMAFTTTATILHHLDSNVKLRVPTALTVKPHPDRTWSITFNEQAGMGFDLGLTHTLISHEKPSPVKFSHDGKYVAVGCSGGEAHIFEVETGTLTRILRNVLSREEEPIEAASFSRDGKYLATGSSEGDINIWEIKTKHVRNTFQDHTHEILSLNFSPDDRLLVSTAGDNSVRLWDMRNGATTFLTDDEEEYHKGNDDDNMFLDYPRHTSAVFSPDGRFLATSHRDGMLRIWGVRSGRLLRRIKAHRDCVYDVAFTPNGKGLVSASQDRTLKYWDISSLYNSQARLEVQTQPVRVFLGHEGHVHSLAISPDGRWIASGSADKTVRIWDTRNGMMQCTLNLDDHVSGVNFSPKGRYLASAGSNGIVRIWRY